jgi:hypothetical protein
MTTTDYSFLSLLASLSSANAAKITKATPHVLTTLPAPTATATGTGSTNSQGQFQENESGSSGSVISSTSKAGGIAANGRGGWGGRERGSSVIWELSAGSWGLLVGLLGIVL